MHGDVADARRSRGLIDGGEVDRARQHGAVERAVVDDKLDLASGRAGVGAGVFVGDRSQRRRVVGLRGRATQRENAGRTIKRAGDAILIDEMQHILAGDEVVDGDSRRREVRRIAVSHGDVRIDDDGRIALGVSDGIAAQEGRSDIVDDIESNRDGGGLVAAGTCVALIVDGDRKRRRAAETGGRGVAQGIQRGVDVGEGAGEESSSAMRRCRCRR